MGEGVFEFEATAADVLEVGAEEADGGSSSDGGAGFVDALFFNKNATGEDQGLGTLAGGRMSLVDEELVETDLFVALFWGILHSRVSISNKKKESAASIFSWFINEGLPIERERMTPQHLPFFG
jgi:hypothetical protein